MTRSAVLLPRDTSGRSSLAPGLDATTIVAGGRSGDGGSSGALFYWSDTRFVSDFEVGLHRHEAFEIVTVVLDGTTSHYDTTIAEWVDLHPGDAHILRAGSGVMHNERVLGSARVFTIWLDPDLRAALERPASYSELPARDFPVRPGGDGLVTDLVGEGAPLQAWTEGLAIRRLVVPGGSQGGLDLPADRTTFAYLADGAATVNGAPAGRGDAVRLDGPDAVTVDAATDAELYLVSVASNPGYRPVQGR